MRYSIIATLVLLSGPALAAMPHHRLCDKVQDHPERYTKQMNPAGGNAVMFGGRCQTKLEGGIRSNWWKVLNCGYQAYREGQPEQANPHPQAENGYRDAWEHGWKTAQRSCTKKEMPF